MAADAPGVLGRCGADGLADSRTDPISLMSHAEWWAQVMSVDSVAVNASVLGTGTFDPVPVTMRRIDGVGPQKSVGQEQSASLSFHTSMLPGIQWALDNGHDVYVAMASKGLEAESVVVTLIVTTSGETFFVGECEYDAFTVPARIILKDERATALSNAVGATSRSDVETALGLDENPAAVDSPVTLNPNDSPP